MADQVAKLMTKKRIHVVDSKILIMGLTFKENCPDFRNTRVVDLIAEFESFNCHVDVYDPWVDKQDAEEEYGIILIEAPQKDAYDAVVLAVAHDEFKALGAEQMHSYGKEQHVLYYIKYLLDINDVDGRL